ncbi:PDZ domain containing protein [Nitzschia inconspicua]|uniref:PDZ domain containing protein n=1 Tax=Nitzschia inconspicua TaxID=303405 RepID=A0A9K3PGR0_9STRA|nr:PDZ domain containing protein [Nitzschia inconspicua]KAG7346771.1 PDZ domain containing protein [Nitzschia inconspicua]
MSMSDGSNTIKPGDLLWGQVKKSKNANEDTGVKLCDRNSKLWVIRIQDGSLFHKWTPLQAGDQLLAVNDRNVDGMSVDEVHRIFQTEQHIKIKALRAQYGLYDSSSSTHGSAEESDSSIEY